MLNGFLDLSVGGVILYALIVTHITIVGVTVFLHRYQAHRALEMHPLVSHFFRFWLWLTTGMVTRQWAAVHRKHHAKCETADDPHSPQVKGLREVFLRGAELYRREADNAETVEKYGKGTPDDWLERHIYTPHNYKGIVVMLGLNLLLLGPLGLTVWAVQMIWIPLWAAGVINGIGHYFGYRNYDCPDASTNIVPWGILIGGEELHNNHHAYPGSAKLSARRWEFDIGWMYIRLLELVGLAKVKKVAPVPVPTPKQAAPLDVEAVRAIASHRFQVLARYGKDVLARVYRDEVRRIEDRSLRGLLKRGRRLLQREASMLDAQARQRLESVLAHNPTLRTVYEYRLRLQAIWQNTTHGSEQALHALQEWRHQAEASGIHALEEFARRLGGFRQPQAV